MSRRPRRRSGSRRAAASTASFAPADRAGHCLASPAGLRAKAAAAGRAVKIGLADPDGAALYHYFTQGELKSEGSSFSEGIGQGRITRNLEGLSVDSAYNVSDAEALPIVFDLLRNEGLVLGLSSGINVAGAIRLAKDLGPGHLRCHDPLRLRLALRIQAVQPGISTEQRI